MADPIRIVALALVAGVLLVFLRKEFPAFGVQVAMAFVVVVLLVLLGPIREVIDAFRDLAGKAQVRTLYLALVLKAIAIAYITSLGAEMSRDAGEDAVGAVVELAGKVFILLLAVPVIAAILETLVRLLPG